MSTDLCSRDSQLYNPVEDHNMEMLGDECEEKLQMNYSSSLETTTFEELETLQREKQELKAVLNQNVQYANDVCHPDENCAEEMVMLIKDESTDDIEEVYYEVSVILEESSASLQAAEPLYLTSSVQKEHDETTVVEAASFNSECTSASEVSYLVDLTPDDKVAHNKSNSIITLNRLSEAFRMVDNYYLCMVCGADISRSPTKYGSRRAIMNHIKYTHIKFQDICSKCEGKCTINCNLEKYEPIYYVCPSGLSKTKLVKTSNATTKPNRSEVEKKWSYKNSYKRVENSNVCTICPKPNQPKFVNYRALTRHIKCIHYSSHKATLNHKKNNYLKLEDISLKYDRKFLTNCTLAKHDKDKHLKYDSSLKKVVHTTNAAVKPNIFQVEKQWSYENTYKRVGNCYVCILCPEPDQPKYINYRALTMHIKCIHFESNAELNSIS